VAIPSVDNQDEIVANALFEDSKYEGKERAHMMAKYWLRTELERMGLAVAVVDGVQKVVSVVEREQ
jgi:hypothetical protein